MWLLYVDSNEPGLNLDFPSRGLVWISGGLRQGTPLDDGDPLW